MNRVLARDVTLAFCSRLSHDRIMRPKLAALSLVPRPPPTRGEGLVTQARFLGLAEALKPCNCKCKNAN